MEGVKQLLMSVQQVCLPPFKTLFALHLGALHPFMEDSLGVFHPFLAVVRLWQPDSRFWRR